MLERRRPRDTEGDNPVRSQAVGKPLQPQPENSANRPAGCPTGTPETTDLCSSRNESTEFGTTETTGAESRA